MEDDRVALLEAQLSQAKLIAEEADKKYEEVRVEVDSTCDKGDRYNDEMIKKIMTNSLIFWSGMVSTQYRFKSFIRLEN